MKAIFVTTNGINISTAIERAQEELKKETTLSPSFKVTVELLITIVILLVNKLGLNSSNSSKPPSSDPNRKKKQKKKTDSKKNPGGQKGHKGTRANA